MKTSEVLNLTADRLEAEGWTQHTLGPASGPHCLVGALRRVGGVPEECLIPDGPVGDAYVAIVSHIGTEYPAIWNDDRDRTAEQVIATLRAAAVIEAARENADARQAVQA